MPIVRSAAKARQRVCVNSGVSRRTVGWACRENRLSNPTAAVHVTPGITCACRKQGRAGSRPRCDLAISWDHNFQVTGVADEIRSRQPIPVGAKRMAPSGGAGTLREWGGSPSLMVRIAVGGPGEESTGQWSGMAAVMVDATGASRQGRRRLSRAESKKEGRPREGRQSTAYRLGVPEIPLFR